MTRQEVTQKMAKVLFKRMPIHTRTSVISREHRGGFVIHYARPIKLWCSSDEDPALPSRSPRFFLFFFLLRFLTIYKISIVFLSFPFLLRLHFCSP